MPIAQQQPSTSRNSEIETINILSSNSFEWPEPPNFSVQESFSTVSPIIATQFDLILSSSHLYNQINF